MLRYESLKPPRLTRELLQGGYQFVIPARKNWFILPILALWLAFWSFGGAMVIWSFIESQEAFLAVWLLFWAVAWLYAASQLIYMIAGKEIIRLVDGDLAIECRSFLLNKTWIYRGSDVRKLEAIDTPDVFGLGLYYRNLANPIFARKGFGSLRFNYGARTVYAGAALDRAEAEMIVADLLRSLPAAG